MDKSNNLESTARDLSSYHPDAQASIKAGLASGHVRFEANPKSGGEYIYSRQGFKQNSKSSIGMESGVKENVRSVRQSRGATNAGLGLTSMTGGNPIKSQVGDFPARSARQSRAV